MKAMVLCVCGRVHLVGVTTGGMVIIACPECPPGELWSVDLRYCRPREVKIPRPEAVW